MYIFFIMSIIPIDVLLVYSLMNRVEKPPTDGTPGLMELII